MPLRWEDAAVRALAAKLSGYPEELPPLIHASRRIGSDPGLVLHGGGNTSAKVVETDIFGDAERRLYVKGSGVDMASIGVEGFSVLRLDPIRRLRDIADPPEADLQNHLAVHRAAAGSPDPSMETLLHAFLPHRFVFHCHADALLVLTHQSNPRALIRSVLGEKAAVIPYARPGLSLARAAVEAYEKSPHIDAMVVLHHGLFTFAEDAKEAYNRMQALVKKAASYIRKGLKASGRVAVSLKGASPASRARDAARVSQVIRGTVARKDRNGGIQRRLVVLRESPELIRASLCPEAGKICRSGVLTPDHAIRTRNRMVHLDTVPKADTALKDAVERAVSRFEKDYAGYLTGQKRSPERDVRPGETWPCLFLVAGFGLFAAGETLQAAHTAADIGAHTVSAKWKAFSLGTYRPIPEAHVRDMEVWPLQRKKLKRPEAPLSGQVALVTGGGGAIGHGIARCLLAAGATVMLTDVDARRLEKSVDLLSRRFGGDRIASTAFDVTDAKAVEKGFETTSLRFGGVDLVVPNAGIAHVAKIEDLDPETLDRVTAVNFKGTFTTLKAAVPVFKRQGTGGNIVVISSKNVFDPGAAFSAYSASKAAAHQMAKIAAIELAPLGVRVNMINPDAVFGDENVCSGLWECIGPERMRCRGLSPEGLQDYYCQRSLLKARVTAEHVGHAVVFFAAGKTPTTGASLPVDAGIPAAFPR